MAKSQRHAGRDRDLRTPHGRSRYPGHQGGLPEVILAGEVTTAGSEFNCCLVYVLVTCGVVFTMTDFDPDLRILHNVCVVMCCPGLILHC